MTSVKGIAWNPITAAGMALLCCAAAAPARVTNLNTAVGYDAIQAAVLAASTNDTIEVYNGTYTENVVVTNVTGLTIRAAPGHTAIVTPIGTNTAFTMKKSDTTVQGFEITGAGATKAFHLRDPVTGNTYRQRVLDNTIHHMSTSADLTVFNVDYHAYQTTIAGNTIRDLGNGTTKVVVLVMNAYASVAFNSNVIHAVHPHDTVYSTMLDFRGAGSRMIGNDISGIVCAHANTLLMSVNQEAKNSLIQGNRFYDGGGAAGLMPIRFGYWTDNNTVLNNNRFSGWARLPLVDYAAPVRVFANNIMDTRSAAGFILSASNRVENNILLGDRAAISMGATANGNVVRFNTVLEQSTHATGPSGDDNTRIPPNTWTANFYATNVNVTPGKGAAIAAPYTNKGSAGTVDSAALQGYWARATLPAGQTAVSVGHPSDTNRWGARTTITYDTTRGGVLMPGLTAYSRTNSVFIHILGMTRTNLTGIPVKQTVPLGSTLQTLHSFMADGEFFATVQLAFDPAVGDGVGLTTPDLFWWNVREYTNQFWELAVAGNVTNAYFPSNTIQRVIGTPTAVLGNYGVDAASRFVWANVNHVGDLSAFAYPATRGTVLMID